MEPVQSKCASLFHQTKKNLNLKLKTVTQASNNNLSSIGCLKIRKS